MWLPNDLPGWSFRHPHSHAAYWHTVGHLAAVLSGLGVDKDIVMRLLDALYHVQELIITDAPVLAGPQGHG